MLLSATRRFAPIAVLLLIASAEALAGPITVMPTVTRNGSMFHYDYTVTNMTGLDLTVLDIAVATGPTVFNLMAPTGFQAAFDSGLGLVSFLENTSALGASPIAIRLRQFPRPRRHVVHCDLARRAVQCQHDVGPDHRPGRR